MSYKKQKILTITMPIWVLAGCYIANWTSNFILNLI